LQFLVKQKDFIVFQYRYPSLGVKLKPQFKPVVWLGSARRRGAKGGRGLIEKRDTGARSLTVRGPERGIHTGLAPESAGQAAPVHLVLIR